MTTTYYFGIFSFPHSFSKHCAIQIECIMARTGIVLLPTSEIFLCLFALATIICALLFVYILYNLYDLYFLTLLWHVWALEISDSGACWKERESVALDFGGVSRQR